MDFVKTDKAPEAIGPYSQAVITGNLVFCSGQIPLDPATMQLVGDNITEQAKQVLSNIAEVLKAAGSAVDKVVKVNVYLKDMNDFATVNEIYGNFFGDHKPARAAVEVSRLPKDVMIEIECIAEIS